MPSSVLAVWVNGARVGEWRLLARDTMEFQYDDNWVHSKEGRPLSLSMPFAVGNPPIRSRAVECYFDNLLPDSDSIRKRLQSRFKTDSTQAFDLLSAIGRDCVGAVQLLPVGDKPQKVRSIEAEPLTKAQVAGEIARSLTATAVNMSDDDFRISIAGAQEKSAFSRHNGKWCKPHGATPTTHIFKLPLGLVGNMQADMSSSVENEWLCSRLLAAYKVPVATCEIETFADRKVLVVERFDRVLHSSGKYWLRLVQEDMCQATATPSHRKYEADGGPGILDVARILQTSVNRDEDLLCLFKAQLLFWMLAATDGHAKNFSIRMLSGGRYQLTPLYDVLSAWPVIGAKSNQISPHKARLAMAIHATNTHYRIKDIHRRHFEHLAKQFGIVEEGRQAMDELIDVTPSVIEQVTDQLPNEFPVKVSDAVFKGLTASAKKLAVR